MINEGEGGALVEEWVELANGCICCTVKHSLVQALEQLVQRKERSDHLSLYMRTIDCAAIQFWTCVFKRMSFCFWDGLYIYDLKAPILKIITV